MIHFKSVCCVFFVSCLAAFSILPAQEVASLEELAVYLTPAQRVNMLKAEELIRVGQSEVASGQHYASRKPSKLNPDEDVEAIRKRGEKLIVAGQTKITEGERILGELKETAVAQKAAAIANRIKEYVFEIDRLDLDQALEATANEVLNDAWNQNYDILLYDGLYVTDAEGTRAVAPDTRNQIYDLLVEIDGTNFSVSVPIGLSLEVQPETGTFEFAFENQAAFEGDEAALLAMELHLSEDEAEGLLIVSAIDLRSKQLIAQSLRSVKNPEVVLSRTDAPAADADALEASSSIPVSATLIDSKDILTAMANLKTSYVFKVDSSKAGTEFKTRALKALLGSLILRETDLSLVDIGYVRRVYHELQPESNEVRTEASEDAAEPGEESLEDEGENEPSVEPIELEDGSTAILALFAKEGPGQYLLRAKAIELESVVDVGSFSVTYPADLADVEAEAAE